MGNEGTFRLLKLVLPAGKLLSAAPSAPMGNYSTPFPTVIDTVIRALEKALPRQRLLQRPDHRIDHGRERCRVVAHGGGRRSAQEFSRRQNELEQPERSFVPHLAGAEALLEGYPRVR